MIDLYSVPTANGQRVHIMLEETGLAYTPHLVDLGAGAHKKPDFTAKNPYGRVPVIVDGDGPGGAPITLSESQLILIYLAEKTGKFMPAEVRARLEVLQWLFFVGANMTGAFRGLFYFTNRAPEKSPMALARYEEESRAGFAVLDGRLKDNEFVAAGQYTVADMSAYAVAVTSSGLLSDGLTRYPNIAAWVDRIGKRPAVQKGMKLFT